MCGLALDVCVNARFRGLLLLLRMPKCGEMGVEQRLVAALWTMVWHRSRLALCRWFLYVSELAAVP